MWGLIPTKDKRKYRIVETLFAAKEPVTIRKLAEQTGASVRIIKYDLDEISESLCGIAGSIVTSSDGVSLTLPASIGMDFFQRGLYSEAMSLRFLENMNERAMDDRLYLLRQMTDAIVEKNKHAYIKSVKERMRRAYV